MIQKVRNYGWKLQHKDDRDYKFTHNVKAESLPTSIDLRPNLQNCYDQGQLGSCTANAIAGAIEYNNRFSSDIMPSRLFIYYNERLIEGTVNEDSGAEIRDGVKVCAKYGFCSELELPYNIDKFKEKPSAKCCNDAVKNKITQYQAVNQTEHDIKSALYSNHLVVFGFMVKESLESDLVAKTGEYKPKSREKILGGHAVAICGYDDTKKVFIIRNSWGNDWGQKGYFTMPYKEVLNPKISNDFWVID